MLSEGEFEGDAYVLFGRADSDDFSLHTVGTQPGRDRVTTGAHIAFPAGDAELGRALARPPPCATAGRTSARPGRVPSTRGHYYAAFVLDPDGNNVEAVFHAPPTTDLT